MTALDQAFIKAYMHHGAAPVAATLSSAKPVRLTEVLAEPAPPEATAEPAAEVPADARADSRAVAVAAALEKSPARSRTAAVRPRSEPSEPARRTGKQGTASKSSGRRSKTTEATKPAGAEKAPSPQTPPAPPAPAARTPLLEGLGLSQGTVPARGTVSDKKSDPQTKSSKPEKSDPAVVASEPPKPLESMVPPAPMAAEVPAPFRPAFQVDRFLWAQGCTRLSAAAADQLDRLADGILNRHLPNQRVVGLCGCRRGDGCTTLLLCVGRRLAAQGRRVLLVDAHFEQPMLARRLGLLPEAGWEDVLWRGLPLAEATIESLEDRLSLLPLRGEAWPGAGAELAPAADMARIVQHYDLVLVDLGRFDLASPKTAAVLRSAHQWIDGVVVVHNVRTTPQSELDYVRRWLRELDIPEAGIAENFV